MIMLRTILFQNATRTMCLTAALLLGALAPALTPAAGAAPAAAADGAAKKPDLDKVGQHLRQHQNYPATRAQLLASCKGLVDFSAGEKRWFAEHLPQGTYQSADEVLKALAAQ
jgi:hypothetical protein